MPDMAALGEAVSQQSRVRRIVLPCGSAVKMKVLTDGVDSVAHCSRGETGKSMKTTESGGPDALLL